MLLIVPYFDVRGCQRPGIKLEGQCNLRRNCEGVTPIISAGLSGARDGNKENISESLLKIVN